MTEYTENQLRYRRSKGVAKAWDRERELVRQGRGTRQWTVDEQKQILDKGRADHYQGHHMLSVSKYPQHADNPRNIQFLCTKKSNNEHLAAHKGDYRTPSEWRYNVNTGKTRDMNTEKPRAMNSYELSDKAIDKRGYKHYSAASKSAAEKKGTPAQKYASGGKTVQSGTSAKKSPAKNYSSGKNADGLQKFSRNKSLDKSANRSQTSKNTNSPARKTAGQHQSSGQKR